MFAFLINYRCPAIAPSVVGILYHFTTALVKQRPYISLHVLTVDVLRFVMLHSRNAAVVIDEFQRVFAVGLFYELVICVVGIDRIVLAYSSAVAVVGKGILSV